MPASERTHGRPERIRIGISACLLGSAVRYDGGHKRDAFLVETFGRYVEWVPVCPEVELGLGTPRPTLRLEADGDGVRLMMPTTGADYTNAMRRYAQRRAARLAADDLCGYVLKKDSPSCGMARVKVYGARGAPAQSGRGLFAEALLQRFPSLPVEEEGRLNDPQLRESFVERVFAYHRVRALFAARWMVGDLVTFHTAHKLQLLAHSPTAYARLGRLVAASTRMPRPELRARYEADFMSGLAVPATPRRHVNVLQHIAGYFKRQLDDDARRELLALIEDYRAGLIPLVVPITLVRHYVRRFDVAHLKGQVYLEPHPKELMLRNHV
ncbi:MAG TPA: DUF523 and DUF1722 domain-containing protein [Candidatus Acidoferrales bacterium]|nr:DUF523 and DUF1722 domain-containing protein [Candidatus Acidoferrales bacterium]